MAVPTVNRGSGPTAPEALDAGVIKDARARQRRHWVAVAAGGAVAIIVVLIAYGTYAGGATSRADVPAPGATTGRLRSLPRTAYQYWITPDLRAGKVALDVRLNFVSGPSGASSDGCNCDNYPGSTARSMELFPTGLGFTIISGPHSPTTTLNHEVVFVASNVAAVRVGQSGEAGAEAAPDLPPGVKLVAFQVAVPHRPTPQLAHLSAIGSSGRALPTLGADATNFPGEATSTGAGACAIRTDLRGFRSDGSRSVTAPHALPQSLPGVFLSCLNETASFDGANLQVAVLLDAHHPSQTPTNLWGATPLPGHPGIVEVKAPSLFTFDVDTGSPMLARQDGNAWIVVAGRPGVPPAPTMQDRLQTLAATRITQIK